MQRTHRFLIILFGTLQYDGRAQRMIEIISGFGEVSLVDIQPPSKVDWDGIKVTNYNSIELPTDTGKLMRHLRLWLAALRVCWRIRPDVVVAENYFSTLPSYLLSKFWRARFIYDSYELIIPEAGKPMSLRNRFWYLLERWVIQSADLVVAANPERAQQMAEHYQLACTPEYMRNIPPQRKNAFGKKELLAAYPALMRNTQEERIILYQGDMSLARGIDRFVTAVVHLPENYRLVLVGGGPDKEGISALVNQLGINDRVIQLGRISNRKLSSVSQECDIGVVTYPYTGLNNIYCAPNKIYEYAQAGLPIIATNQSPLRRIIEEYDIGGMINENENAAEVAHKICAVVNKGKRAYRINLERFLKDNSWEDEAVRLAVAIERILKEDHSVA